MLSTLEHSTKQTGHYFSFSGTYDERESRDVEDSKSKVIVEFILKFIFVYVIHFTMKTKRHFGSKTQSKRLKNSSQTRRSQSSFFLWLQLDLLKASVNCHTDKKFNWNQRKRHHINGFTWEVLKIWTWAWFILMPADGKHLKMCFWLI